MKKIDNEKLINQFNKEYDFLYEHDDYVAGYDEALQEFDDRIKTDDNFKNIVKEFNDAREDFIASDREAAAFMFALYTLNGGF